MNEIIFLVEEAPEGGYTARALDAAIFTQADDMQSLHEMVRDAVRCHFDENEIVRRCDTTSEIGRWTWVNGGIHVKATNRSI